MSEVKESPDELSKKVKAVIGLETNPVFDNLRVHESDEMGNIMVEAFSDSQLEEDISQMEKTKTLLEEKELKEIIQSAFVDTLLEIGSAIPKDKLERLFPGLDISNPDFPDQYDFNTAVIRVYILSSESYGLLKETIHPGMETNETSGGFATSEVQKSSSKDGTWEIHLNLSEKKNIILREVQPPIKYIGDQMTEANRSLTEREKDLIKLYLKSAVIHELIHNLDVATELPRPFKEGITEWYTQRIINHDLEEPFEPNKIVASYNFEIGSVSILMIGLIENGFNLEQIDKAFVSQDGQEQNKIIKFFKSRYGEEEAMRIINWKFHGSKEAFDFVKGLEIKAGSDYGNLIKIVRKGQGRI
jgi:hypothetical protein